MERVLLHIATRRGWAAARAAGTHRPASLEAEGFVHLSTPGQVLATAARHYRGATDLIVLHIDPVRLVAPLRWDPVAALGEAFPHLYGPLNADAVVAVSDLTETADGFVLGPEQPCETPN